MNVLQNSSKIVLQTFGSFTDLDVYYEIEDVSHKSFEFRLAVANIQSVLCRIHAL